jgi:hypothetical protein
MIFFALVQSALLRSSWGGSWVVSQAHILFFAVDFVARSFCLSNLPALLLSDYTGSTDSIACLFTIRNDE